MAEKEGKYPCPYNCGRKFQNPQAAKMHGKACPQNPDNIPKNKKQETEIQHPPEKEEPSPVTSELSEQDKLLRQYPTIARLLEENEAMKRGLIEIDTQGRSIGELNIKMDAIMGSLERISSLGGQPPEKPPLESKKKMPPQVSDALKASLEADKDQAAGGSPAQSKIDELRREAEKGETKTSEGKASQAEILQGLGDLSSLAGMPEWLQKIMMFGVVAEKFGPLIDRFRGVPSEQPQSPQDVKALERAFTNMDSLFTLALKLTDKVTGEAYKQARKRILEEIKTTYDLTPKLPGAKPPGGEGSEETEE